MSIDGKVLIVGDDPALVQRIRSLLEPLGIGVRAAAAASLLSCYEDWPAELVVCGYPLAGFNDLEFVAAIRARNVRARFVLIAADADRSDFQDMTPNRIVAYLPGDFLDQDLLQHVHAALGGGDQFYNRRGHSRFKLSIDTHCVLINPFTSTETRPVAGLIRDVSRSGLSLLVRQLFPVPTMIKLMVQIPQTRRSVVMLAKSLSCTYTQIANVYRLGAKFVGLLPSEMEEAISHWTADHPGLGDSDIFMGKSFRKAIEEWLTANQRDLPGQMLDPVTPLPRLASELSNPMEHAEAAVSQAGRN